MMNENILLTGSTGFIGSSLLKKLSNKGYNVISVDRNLNCNRPLLDTKYYLIHMGSYILKSTNSIYNIEKSITDNILWTYKVLEQFENKLCGICYISTTDVYGIPNILPITENNLIKPITAYAISKLCAEYYINLVCKNIPTAIIRLGNVYGPNDTHPKVLQSFINAVNNNQPIIIYGDGSDLRDYIHIADVINGIICVLQTKNNNDIFNLASGCSYSINDLAKLVIIESQKEIPIIYNDRINKKTDYIFDINKFTSTFQFQPNTNIQHKLRELITYDI